MSVIDVWGADSDKAIYWDLLKWAEPSACLAERGTANNVMFVKGSWNQDRKKSNELLMSVVLSQSIKDPQLIRLYWQIFSTDDWIRISPKDEKRGQGISLPTISLSFSVSRTVACIDRLGKLQSSSANLDVICWTVDVVVLYLVLELYTSLMNLAETRHSSRPPKSPKRKRCWNLAAYRCYLVHIIVTSWVIDNIKTYLFKSNIIRYHNRNYTDIFKFIIVVIRVWIVNTVIYNITPVGRHAAQLVDWVVNSLPSFRADQPAFTQCNKWARPLGSKEENQKIYRERPW